MEKFKNKLFFAPVNTGLTDCNVPSEALINFYTNRSSPYIDVCYIGNVAINSNCMTNPTNLLLLPACRSWHTLIDGIKQKGSLPAIQLGCCFDKNKMQRKWISDKENFLRSSRHEFSNISKSFFDSVFHDFVTTARQAYKMGCKIIQIHAAHGYFLSMFLNNAINIRTDEFSHENCDFLKNLVAEIKTSCSDVILDIRISLYSGLDEKAKEFSVAHCLVEKLISCGFDIISFSNGLYNYNKNYIYPPESFGHLCYLEG